MQEGSIAKNLASDLKKIGEAYGFVSLVEESPMEGSSLAIDVVWAIQIESKTDAASLIPDRIIITTIEIQYSKSPPSITHGVAKAKLANSPHHIIITFQPASESNKSLWMQFYPNLRGLKIIEGPQQIERLRAWISCVLERNKEINKRGNSIKENILSKAIRNDSDKKEIIHGLIAEDIDDIFFEPSDFIPQNLLRDVPKEELSSIVNNINNSILVEKQWIRLDNICLNGRIWVFDELWTVLNNELFSIPIKPNARRALFIIKIMLINSKSELDRRVVQHISNNLYLSRLETLFSQPDVDNDIKLELINIFKLILDQKERFSLYWRYWNNMLVLEDDSPFIKSTQIMMNDFKLISKDHRNKIEAELVKLSQSPENRIAQRAETLYGWLFT